MRVVDLCFEDCNKRHQDYRIFLVVRSGKPASVKLRAIVLTVVVAVQINVDKGVADWMRPVVMVDQLESRHQNKQPLRFVECTH